MFFTGDSTNRKRVDLGGRSSKERDRQVLLEQARIERKRRQVLREQTSAAIKIQKCFRAQKDLEVARFRVRQQFHATFGDRCQKADWHCFGPNSWFLRQLLFFFTASNAGDVALLVEACKLLLQFHHENGNIVSVFAGLDYSANHGIVNQRVKKLAYVCLQAIYQNRNQLRNQLLMSSANADMNAVILLNTVACLTNPELPWTCKIIDHLLNRKVFFLLRHIILSGVRDLTSPESRDSVSSLEHVLISITSHSGQHACDSNVHPKWSFSLQLLSVPFLWRHLPYFKEVFLARGLGKHYLHQLASVLPGCSNALPNDTLQEYGGYGCLLANLLEVAGSIISEQCSVDIAMDFIHVSTFLLEALPPVEQSAGENLVDDDLTMEESEKESLSPALQNQINNYMDPRVLQRLVDCLFETTWKSGYSNRTWPSNRELEVLGAVCTFLHVMFSTLQHEAIMMRVAYRTEIIPVLWNFIKCCYAHKRWPSFSMPTAHIPGDEPGWLLPLAVFSPLFRYMLKFLDNEEFYEMEKPLNLSDMKSLVIIIKEALWQLLWLMPGSIYTSQRLLKGLSSEKKLSIEVIKHRASIAMSELLCQLQDWNNRKQFISPDDFHVVEATGDIFISQASVENSRASEILKQAPFLVPFTTRVKIFASELAASRQTNSSHPAFPRHQFKIRRDRILEDAFSQLSVLSEDDLRAPIRVSFVNEFGVEEAGIDGGGIFKDFMENIIQTAFDVQYGLFKETTDHSLYPNPGSALVNEQHLQYFHFLGSLLGKAMYEGILVDIPFATFFLSKLKEKSNFLHDLPSLDPELYRHLIFLKHYKGNISELELYFVVVSNEYGEQIEEELIPGGKDRRVTNENVIQFIHLMANYRLNYQIRSQSSYFLRGFQRLIRKEWLEMFNEHEIQLLISGSLDVIDIDDLRSNTHYTGGYHPTHHVIEMFWEVFKSFSLEHQKKFLKFVTGCSRGPLLGFKFLEPKFCIQRTGSNSASASEDLDRLPTSATCMNLLKLPPYESKERMQTKLLYAISAEAGFDLS